MNPNVWVLATTALVAALLLVPRLARQPVWRAALTPLASIIGSGFLVLGPILDAAYGGLAPLVMLGLCAVAWGFGAAIRRNIVALAGTGRDALDAHIERLASLLLGGAYMISVAYYLNLFGAFAVTFTPVDDAFHARLVTTAVLAVVLGVGLTRGFAAFEAAQAISNLFKLAIIAGLLVGLALYNADALQQRALYWNPVRSGGWASITLAFGLIITVQGFETSRYLAERGDPALRCRSMRLAQALSAAIYLSYALLLAYAFAPDDIPLSQTGIIDMMERVAPVLPVLLVVAALAAQFGAAVADTSGSGGLIEETSGGRVPARVGYALLAGIAIALTWSADLFSIISYASRAFAAYYGLQCVLAVRDARRNNSTAAAAAVVHGSLAVLAVAIVVFGRSVE